MHSSSKCLQADAKQLVDFWKHNVIPPKPSSQHRQQHPVHLTSSPTDGVAKGNSGIEGLRTRREASEAHMHLSASPSDVNVLCLLNAAVEIASYFLKQSLNLERETDGQKWTKEVKHGGSFKCWLLLSNRSIDFPSFSPSWSQKQINPFVHLQCTANMFWMILQNTHTKKSRWTYFMPGCLSECVMNTNGNGHRADRQSDRQLSSCSFVLMESTLWHVPAAPKIFSDRIHT